MASVVDRSGVLRRSFHQRRQHAFTLVELLVVIGIIAVLIGVLLPALGAARRQANTVKCSSQLREIGNALMLYANENRGAWPVVQFQTTASFPTDPAITQLRNPANPNIYWYMFLLKYFTKRQYTDQVGLRLLDFMNTPLFGCPAVDKENFDSSNSSAEFNSGYGMGPYALYAPNKYIGTNSGPPPGSIYVGSHWAFIASSNGCQGRFFKQSQWTNPAEHGIIADTRSWFLEIRSPGTGTNVTIPEQGPGAIGYDSAALDQFDRYRHAKSRKQKNVAFNVLFCDGHVATLLDIKDGFIAFRRHFPG